MEIEAFQEACQEKKGNKIQKPLQKPKIAIANALSGASASIISTFEAPNDPYLVGELQVLALENFSSAVQDF